MIHYPILGALALASGTIFQKIVLKRKRINIQLYQVLEFFAILLLMLPIVYFFWKIDYSQVFILKNIFIFSLVIAFSIVANLFTFYSMKWEKVSNLEPAKILEPLFVILLAIFFSYLIGQEMFERNTKIIIPALIAGIVLVFSHLKKHHLNFNKYFIAAVLGSFFFALELVISRLILNIYSPITFYFLRCSFIFLISWALFRPKLIKLNAKVKLEILAIGACWVFYRVIIYYGYLSFGVIFTTLMIMMGPVLIYIFAWKFLKEKLEWRNLAAALIIVGCVLYATLG
ncbi:MAG: DMT family transporter [Nanoarchaeota archaeon]|nr:DMT family transporter [Nanoarchaeota archaeon]